MGNIGRKLRKKPVKKQKSKGKMIVDYEHIRTWIEDPTL